MSSVRDTSLSRRALIAGIAVAPLMPTGALAFSQTEAENLIGSVVSRINTIIGAGRSEVQMYRDFESILKRYADMSGISRSVLGPPARSASAAQLSKFQAAFQRYLARKYGARFREFIGGDIQVASTQKVGSIYDVRSTMILKGRAPFEISFIVHERSGKFIDLQIEGISLLKSERAEIGAKLDQASGSIDQLIATL